MVLEGITESRIQRKIAVSRESVTRTEAHLVSHTSIVAIAQVERIDDWRHTERCIFGFCTNRCDEVIANCIPENSLQEPLFLGCGVLCLYQGILTMLNVVSLVNQLVGLRELSRSDLIH